MVIISSIDIYSKKIIDDNKSTQIIFIPQFNDYIPENFIPEYVEKIMFGYKSNLTYYEYDLDKMVYGEEILMDDVSYSKFNSKSINNFSSNTNIKWIIFPHDSTFNQLIISLPSELEFLSLGINYSKSLENLPNSLKYFIFSTQNYNPDIEFLPGKIEYFGIKTSNDLILNILPKSTKYIDICRDRDILLNNNQALDLLPDNVQVLKLHCVYNSELQNIPKGLKKLYISNLYSLDNLRNLPETLEELEINFSARIHENDIDSYFSNLPTNLKKLKINSNLTYNLKQAKLNLNNLPNSLLELSLTTYLFDGIFDNLPNSITGLYIINCDIESNLNAFNNLPRNLKYLQISINKKKNDSDKKNISFYNLPNCLERIIIGTNINYKFDKNYIESKLDNQFIQIYFNSQYE